MSASNVAQTMAALSDPGSQAQPVHLPPRLPFVGRSSELAELISALPRANTHGSGLWLVAGEAGIGKTRLVSEVAAAADVSGHQVAWGQCWNGSGTPPYWPWTQVIRRLRGIDSGSELRPLVLGDDDGDADAFALYDAVATELRRAAWSTPTLVVLDDLHLADVGSLQLTRFVAGHLADAPIQILATLRRPAPPDRRAIVPYLDELASTAPTIDLGGLDLDEVAQMVSDEAPGVRAVTGGNPLHIEHLVRAHLPPADRATVARGGGRHRSSAALGAVLTARITSMDAESLDLLAALEVLDHRATVPAAAQITGIDPDRVHALATALREAGLVEPDGIRLAHSLVADAVADVVPINLREDLHLAAARLAAADGAPIAEQAHHLHRAGRRHRRETIVAWREAAAIAAGSFAHDDAVDHLGRALQLLGDGPADADVRAEVTLALAGAVERTMGSVAADPAYRDALEAARRTADPDAIARAAARHGIAFYSDPDVQLDRAEECRSALAKLGAGDSPLRARLLANLVAADPRAPDRAELAASAVALARRTGDPEAIGVALVSEQLVDLGPSTLVRRLRTSREIVALAETCGEPDLAIRGRFLLKNALLEAGDLRELDAELATQDRTISAIGEPRFARHVLWFRCMRAMLDGRAHDAEQLAEQCFALAQELHDPDGFGVYAGQYGVALWLQGRLAELEPIYVDLMHQQPDDPLWPAVVAWIALGDGRPETARGMLALLPDPAAIPGSMHSLLNLFTMADVAAAVGDDDLVTKMRDALLPYADRAVPIAMGAACFGIVARPLGHLAVRLGRIDEAIAHLEHAIEVAARMGARPWLVDSQLALAQVLATSEQGDLERARALRDEAAATADALSLSVFQSRIEALADLPLPSSPHGGSGGSSQPAPPAGPRVRISVLGTFEVHTITGDRARWTSRKARSLLKILVARRGAPIAREQLMAMLWPDDDPAELANRMAVAVSTVRRALDPGRTLPPDTLVRTDGGSLCLVTSAIDIDVETFLDAAAVALEAHRSGAEDAEALLRRALATQHGEAMPDEPYEDWAAALRRTVTAAHTDVLRALAARATAADEPLQASEALRRLVELDPFDEAAHTGLIDALEALGALGQVRAAREHYAACMAELGVPLASARSGSAHHT